MLSRRRFLTIASAACLAGPTAARAHVWQGTALGAKASIVLDHPDAGAIVEAAVAEIDRLENIFSIYRAGSQISRLNRDGHISTPAFEMLDCLSIVRRVWDMSEGRFDPTIQPVWRVLADARERGVPANPRELAGAWSAVGFEHVRFDGGSVELGRGQAITLNGVAQGFIADRVADLMRRAGVGDVLIDTGEIVALGNASGGDGWAVTIAGEPVPRRFSGRALATSAPAALLLDVASGRGHILDPRGSGSACPSVRQVTVSADRAALADALSTALCLVADGSEAREILRGSKDARIESLYFVE